MMVGLSALLLCGSVTVFLDPLGDGRRSASGVLADRLDVGVCPHHASRVTGSGKLGHCGESPSSAAITLFRGF